MKKSCNKNNIFNVEYINMLEALNEDDSKEINRVNNSFYGIDDDEIKTYACINEIDLDNKDSF